MNHSTAMPPLLHPAYLALLLLLAGPVGAAPAPDNAPGLRFVVGNDLWQPGKIYRSEAGWLGLLCSGNECALTPARLKVSKKSWQGHYDDSPTDGQQVNFTLEKPAKGRVVAWFRADGSAPWLKPGPVPMFAKKPADGTGTLETQVALPGGETALLVPLLARAGESTPTTTGSVSFHLQLRASGRRQMLGGVLGACSRTVNPAYLLWAGDLDGDGKADYLVSFVDAGGQVLLYLSGEAKPEENVGLAAAWDAPPFGGECDGSGWFE